MIDFIRHTLIKLPFRDQLKKLYLICPPQLKSLILSKFVGDYNSYHAKSTTNYINILNKKVLIVGCNTGKDCSHFIDLGAREVHGLDVIDDIGSEYTHPKVSYYKMSVEDMDLESDSYDLVYCFATMEHVPHIDLAFPEMVRVTKSGGIIYSIAAPLWNSQNGHHKGNFFEHYPWIHLRMTKSEIIEYCTNNNITDPTNEHTMQEHVEYMLDSRYFNKTDSSEYIKVCNDLPNLEVLTNKLALDDDKCLTPEIYAELAQKGYSREELLASTHTLIAKKLSVTD